VRDLTVSEIERLRTDTQAEAVALQMDEDAFRGFYDRTARALHAYLARTTGDQALADDLLQESYYRFLRARGAYESDAHRRNALFRIATNLVHDARRRISRAPLVADIDQQSLPAASPDRAAAERAADLRRGMSQLKPRERAMLWLAYAQGSSHREIAECMGLRTGSVKLLLFRARRRLAALLREARAGRPATSGAVESRPGLGKKGGSAS
jgi:RNA polymerase sigma-70 factor (ECF subfamily)